MTIVVLDRVSGPLPPYSEWLRDGARDVVLFTARPAAEITAHDVGAYAEVRCFSDYARSADVDRAVFDLAARTALSAVVAVSPADAIRAGALREHLGLAGQRREAAITFSDLVAMRGRLERAGIATVPCAAVERVADVYAHAGRWGYPVHVRRRRNGWAPVSVLRDEAAAREFTRGGLSPDLQWVPGLVMEPWPAGAVRRVAGVTAEGTWRLYGVAEEDGPPYPKTPYMEAPYPRTPYPREGTEDWEEDVLAAAGAVLAALPAADAHPYLVELRRGDDGRWLADTVGCDVTGPAAGALARTLGADVHRDAVRAQAALPPTPHTALPTILPTALPAAVPATTGEAVR
ncbi:hypothetical protein ACQPYK_36080 [Streptosporangium sp. CA-135522]|uniref:hypothetical protein n=1 Tax=Streptosporangium sp. CA-135522 TaxID=3240072 RepID=UPI003D90B05D